MIVSTLRKTLGCVFLVIPFFVVNVALANPLRTTDPSRYAELEYSLFNPFFEALVSGNIAVIKAHLPAKEYARYERLLERNPDYPEFLRKHYDGAWFVLDEIVDENNVLTGTVQIYWGDGRQTEMEVPLVEAPSSAATNSNTND